MIRTILVTGGNAGIGLSLVQQLAGRPKTRVIMTSRSAQRGEAALAKVRATHPTADVSMRLLDLVDLESVRRFAEEWGDAPLSTLVCNAGIMWIPYSTSPNGVETTLATNHLGHFALCSRLINNLEAAQGRVVVVASLKALEVDKLEPFAWADANVSADYNKNTSYARSKLANLQYAYALHRRLRARGSKIGVIACHPGVSADTELFSRMIPQVAKWVMRKTICQPNVEACTESLLAAIDDSQDHSSNADLVYLGPTGFKQFSGPVGDARVPTMARDEAMQDELWACSESWAGVSLPG
jgi:NAD(P)-dependent dehydrogenase (short-subunit alcohol dehydrogenase family)